jgi:hypothetical protein
MTADLHCTLCMCRELEDRLFLERIGLSCDFGADWRTKNDVGGTGMPADVYDPIAMTELFLFGTTNIPADNTARIIDQGATGATINYVMSDYLTVGAGRYAVPGRAAVIADFFGDSGIPDGTYSLADLEARYGPPVSEKLPPG